MHLKKVNHRRSCHKIDWKLDLKQIIEHCQQNEVNYFDKLLIEMLLIYNVSDIQVPFNSIIIFNDQTIGVSKLPPSELIDAWLESIAHITYYFIKHQDELIGTSKKKPHTLGQYAFQRFDDPFAVKHFLGLHHIKDYYADAKMKRSTWIEVNSSFKIRLELKDSYLDSKMAIFQLQNKYQMPFFNQMAFYSNLSKSEHPHYLHENQHPEYKYRDFGRLDTMYDLVSNTLKYVIGDKNLDKVMTDHAIAKLNKIKKARKD